MWQRRRGLALAMCAIVALFMLASSAYLAHEVVHRHECAGEDCAVCRFIAQIAQLRRGFGMSLAALSVLGFALVAHREGCARATESMSALCTLVGRKTRLND